MSHFHVNIDGNSSILYSIEELQKNNLLEHDTYVWKPGMPQWQMAREVEELKFMFSENGEEKSVMDNNINGLGTNSYS